MKYVVTCTEHDETHCLEPHICAIFNSKEDAEKEVCKCVKSSLKEFPDEIREDWNIVRTYDEDGKVGYGCVWSILEVDEGEDDSANKFGVPSHRYRLHFEDGTEKLGDVNDESFWGDIQGCVPGDCEDWVEAIGYGNDCDGHKKIVRVTDEDDGGVWFGNKGIRKWYDERIVCYLDNYSC